MDWWILRIATSEHFRCPPPVVRCWPLWDVCEAHRALDAIEAAQAIYEQRAKLAARR